MSVEYTNVGRAAVITIDRPERRNAVDRATAEALGEAWRRFEEDASARVGILTGEGGHFSAGADLKAFDLVDTPDGFLGFTRMSVSKPTIAAVEGACVAGGLEMALWCDLRVAGRSAFFGCLERRFGVPLVDGGTQRLPRVVGLGRALDLILTGRRVDAEEARAIGLVDRLVDDGRALAAALELAELIASYPQETVRSDREAVLRGVGVPLSDGLELERQLGRGVLDVAVGGVRRFAAGEGRHGAALTTQPETTTREDSVRSSPVRARPGLLIIHDRWGLTRSVRQAADYLEDQGYVVSVPDLFRGEVPGSAPQADRLVAELHPDEATRLLLEAADELVTDPRLTVPRLGVVGLGMGGGLALWVACLHPRVAACVVFGPYQPFSRDPDYGKTRAAFLGHFGAEDPRAGERHAYSLESSLRDLGLDATFEVYRGAGQGFWDPGRPESFKQEAARTAWERTVSFLDRTLQRD